MVLGTLDGFNEAAGNTPRKTTRRRTVAALAPGCFNEAAGNTPRKTRCASSRRSCRRPAASMRPRGIPRGKPPRAMPSSRSHSCFNEAAGNTPRKTPGRAAILAVLESGGRSSASMRPRGIPRGKRTARKPLCMKGLPWQSRAVSRRCVATAENTAASGEFMGQKYSIIKDPRALRALPGGTTAPKRSIHGGEMRITR